MPVDWQESARKAAAAAEDERIAAEEGAEVARTQAIAARQQQEAAFIAEREEEAHRLISKWRSSMGIRESSVRTGVATYTPPRSNGMSSTGPMGYKGSFWVTTTPHVTVVPWEAEGYSFSSTVESRPDEDNWINHVVQMRAEDPNCTDGWSWVDVTTQVALGAALGRMRGGTGPRD